MKISRKFKSYPAILMLTACVSGLPAQEPGTPPDQKIPPAAGVPGSAPSEAAATPPAPPADATALPAPALRRPIPPQEGFLQSPPAASGIDPTMPRPGARLP